MTALSRRLLFALATSSRFERHVRALPGGEQAAYRFARRYVAGTARTDAFTIAHQLATNGMRCSIDLLGESVSDPAEADRVADSYVQLACALHDAPRGTFLSIDLSHIGIDEPGDEVHARITRIAGALPAGATLQVGAEPEARADRTLEAVIGAVRRGLPVSATVQANLKRSPDDTARLTEAGVQVRLVKGAYVEDPAVAYAWGEPADLAFLRLANQVHRAEAELTLGTHDPVLREALLHALPGVGMEMLLGVRSNDAYALVARNIDVRIYVPYGEGWFRYAMRRAAESRGA